MQNSNVHLLQWMQNHQEGCNMRPVKLLFSKSSDPEACRKAYILGYRAGYQDGQCGNADTTRPSYDTLSTLSEPVEAMPLSTHAYNCLSRSGCRYVGDVAKLSVSEIRRIRNMGKITAAEIVQALSTYGITDTDWELAWLTD